MKDKAEVLKTDDTNKDFKGKKPFKRRGKRKNNKGKPGEVANMANNSGGNKDSLGSLNDISWYSKNPELLSAAARVPFPYCPGMTVTLPAVSASDASEVYFDEKVGVPGVFVIDFLATPGFSANVTSPISIAAAELFGRVRSKFSGGLDADAPDMMVYNLALDSVHMYIAHLKRIYKALSLFATQNRDYPDRILKALCGNTPVGGFDVLRRQKVAIWGMINELVHQVNKFVLPKDMDLYTRHRWMCENIYLDSSSSKGQSYVFRPTHVWKYYMSTDTGHEGSALTPVRIHATQDFVGDPTRWYDFGIDLISALSNWDDGYTISGYYTRAFEGSNLYQCELLAQDEEIKPVYVPEVLTQIENAHTVCFDNDTIPNIMQDPSTNALIWTPASHVDVGESKYAITLNLHSALPTGEQVTIASRLCSYSFLGEVVCGTEAVTGFRILTADGDNDFDRNFTSYPSELLNLPTNGATWTRALGLVSRLSHFDHHPVVVAYPQTSAAPTEANTHYFPIGNIDNYTTVEKAAMKEIHKVCTYSEFNCFR